MTRQPAIDGLSDAADAELWADVLTLVPHGGASSPSSQPRHIHAAFLRWLEAADPALTAELHRANAVRPFTLALLPATADGTLSLRVACLHRRVYRVVQERLHQTLAAPWRIRQATYALTGSTVMTDSAVWSGQASFAGLLDQATAAPEVCIEFAMPTAFSMGDVGSSGSDRRKRIELFPQPRFLWESWGRKWNAFAPPRLALDTSAIAEAVQHVLVADYELRTVTLDYGRFWQKGFTGWAHYDLRALAEADRGRLQALAAFSFYGGSGYKTAQGMGLTRTRTRPV